MILLNLMLNMFLAVQTTITLLHLYRKIISFSVTILLFNKLEELYASVNEKERKKGQRHKVFEDSFDAKDCNSNKFVYQELDYMHKNPVSKKWQFVNDFTDYLYSSTSYYEKGIKQYDKLLHVNEVLL